jgi:hypothetical protein
MEFLGSTNAKHGKALAVALTVDVSGIEQGHAGFDGRFESCLDLTHRYRVVN